MKGVSQDKKKAVHVTIQTPETEMETVNENFPEQNCFVCEVRAVDPGAYIVMKDNLPVIKVTPTSTSMAGKIEEGDVILEVDGIAADASIWTMLENSDDLVKLKIYRPFDDNASLSSGASNQDDTMFRSDGLVTKNTHYDFHGGAITAENFDEMKEIQRAITIGIKVHRISDIDNVHQTFACQLTLDIEWQPTKEEYDNWLKLTHTERDSTWRPSWVPTIEFKNAVDITKFEERTNQHGQSYFMISRHGRDYEGVVVISKYERLIQWRVRVEGSFSEMLELENYPFDSQEFSIVIREGHSRPVAAFYPHSRKIDFVEITQIYSTITEWDFTQPYLLFTESNPSEDGYGRSYSECRLKLVAHRRWQTYVYKVGFLLFLITSSSFSTFSIDETADKLAHEATLLLTAVAFYFIISSDIPKISYLTLFDHYVLASFIFMFVFMVYFTFTGIVGVDHEFSSSFTVEDLDMYFAYFMAGGWILYHIYHYVRISCFVLKSERSKVEFHRMDHILPKHGAWKMNRQQQWVSDVRSKFGVRDKRTYFAHQ